MIKLKNLMAYNSIKISGSEVKYFKSDRYILKMVKDLIYIADKNNVSEVLLTTTANMVYATPEEAGLISDDGAVAPLKSQPEVKKPRAKKKTTRKG